MEQPTKDDEEVRSAQVVYHSVEEKFEAVQDEVNLLKAEIKQTLVDLREFMMKQRAISAPSVFGALQPDPANGPGAVEGAQAVAPTPSIPSAMDPAPGAGGQSPMGPSALDYQAESSARHGLDATIMGHIIWWLGTVKTRGLSLKQLKPFLQAYEMAGHLTPAMAKLTYRSLEDIEEVEEPGVDRVFSSHEYSDCLLQLPDIICNPGFDPSDGSQLPPRPKGRQDSDPQQDVDKDSASAKDGERPAGR